MEGGMGNGPQRDAHRANPAVQIETSVLILYNGVFVVYKTKTAKLFRPRS
jgi:hypothetical protein